MTGSTEDTPSGRTVTVRYWAAARSAAGVDCDVIAVAGPVSLAGLLSDVLLLHGDRPRLGSVLEVCSVVVGDLPVGTSDQAEVWVAPGDTVELLPPFAGG
jgi:molybdopterin converting factor small subunit